MSGKRRETLEECEIGDWKLDKPGDPIAPGLVRLRKNPAGGPDERLYFKRERIMEPDGPAIAWVRVANAVKW
jgi:hypothetical protein